MKPFGSPLALCFAVVLLGGGLLVGRYLIPAQGSASGTSAGESATAPDGYAPLSPSLAGLTEGAAMIEPFKGEFADLLREARKAGDWSNATLRLTLLLARTGAPDLARLAAEMAWDEQAEWEENAVRTAIIQRWAETDPKGALAWSESLASDIRSQTRYQILTKWAHTDVSAAVQYARTLKDKDERESALSSIASTVANTDPKEALRILQSMGGSANSWRFGGVFSSWAKNDPAAAHAAALRLPTENERRAALGSVFSAWGQTDPAAASEAALAITNSTSRNQALQNVLSSWADSDPEAAYEMARSLPPGQGKTGSLSSVLQQWAKKDPTRVMELFGTLTRKEQESCFWSISQNLTGSDPTAALAWAKSLPERNMSSNALAQVFQKWASSDGPAAAAALAALPAHLRSNQFQSVASTWAQSDRQAALLWARSLERPLDRSQALAGCLGEIDLSDTTELNAILAEMPKGEARRSLLASIASNQGSNDPEATLSWIRSLSESDRFAAIQNGSLQQIAESDPLAVAELLRDTPDATSNEWLWTSTATSLAQTDPRAALDWAASLEMPAIRRNAEQAALRAWATTDPDAALEYARSLADEKSRDGTVGAILENWANDDPLGLLAWAESASAGERTTALIKAASQLTYGDPSTSAGVLDRLLAQGTADDASNDLRNAVGSVAHAWAGQDVTSACEWAATLPAGKVQNKAIESIAAGWIQDDPMAASEWIRGLPSGEARDGAVGSLVGSISRSDPESALIWASSITDSSRREQNIRSTFQNWRNVDPEGAREALNQASIPEGIRADLLRDLEVNR